MNWGKSIVLAFVLFAAFIASLVMVCVRQDVNLVTKDYYREELAYQEQIDRLTHTEMLEQKPSIEVGNGLLKVTYADFPRLEQGTLELFRPSNPAHDRVYSLNRTDDTEQYVPTDDLPRGLYRARIKWRMEGKEFYLEQVVTL